MNFPIAPFATQTRVRKIILFVCAAIYLCSAALGVVVGLKESRRPGGRLECPAVEEMHRLAYVLRRKPLASSPIHKPHSQGGQAQTQQIVAQPKLDNTTQLPGQRILEVPSARPERSLARTAT